jgi:fumarate hydratase class II
MDATPILVSDELESWARLLELTRPGLDDAVERLGELPLGGSAVGTGVNVPAGFADAVVAALAEDVGLSLRAAPDTPARMAHMGGQGALSGASAALREVAVALTKIANDLRLLASGPATGLAELRLPALQAGSSIMPGKVNPVLCESANQVAARVFGNDAVVAFAASQGILQLNTYLPVMADALLESAGLLGNVMRLVATDAVAGLEVDAERVAALAARTPSLATGLNLLVGYDAAAAIVKEAVATGRTIREVAEERTDLGADELDEALDPRRAASP